MSNKRKDDGQVLGTVENKGKVDRLVSWVLVVWKKWNIHAFIALAILILLIIIAFKAAVEWEINDAVTEVVTKTKSVLQSGDPQVTASLGLEIAQSIEKILAHRSVGIVVYELLIHLAIAVIVALLVINLFEGRLRKENQEWLSEFRNQVTDNVWQAISNRLTPKEVTEQIETVLQLDFVKRDVHYTFTLDNVPGQFLDEAKKGEESKWILFKRELRCTVENISGSEASYKFFARILTTADKPLTVNVTSNTHGLPTGVGLTFPRHVLVNIDGEQKNLEDPKNPFLEFPIKLLPKQSCQINNTYFEILRVNDESYYVQTTPLIGFEVIVYNLISERIELEEKVYLSHPEREKFVPLPTHGHVQHWIFKDKAMMPGQMFSIQWKEKKTSNDQRKV